MNNHELISEIFGCSQDELLMQLEAEQGQSHYAILEPLPKFIRSSSAITSTPKLNVFDKIDRLIARSSKLLIKYDEQVVRKVFKCILDKPTRKVSNIMDKTGCGPNIATQCRRIYDDLFFANGLPKKGNS